jgi:hypothetical protein
MPYRDDTEHLRRRLHAVRDELNLVRRKAEELQHLTLQQQRLENEAREIERDLRLQRQRHALPMLDNLQVASPCEADWERMEGDARRRLCGHCHRQVYNLSAMTRDEISTLLGAPGASPCVRLYQRADGTLLTADCPVGARRRRWIAFSALAFGVLTGSVLLFAGRPPSPPAPSPLAPPPIPSPTRPDASVEIAPSRAPEPCSAKPATSLPYRVRMGRLMPRR